jgi:heme exporter protein D
VDGIDSSTWQALGATLTLLGLLLSVVVWRRRGPAPGLRGVAWSLLPAAAGLTGTLRLLWEVGDSVVTWATRLVFSPVVWLGVVLAAVSLLLFMVTGVMRARGVGSRRAGARADGDGSGDGSGARRRKDAELPTRRSAPRAKPAVGDEDMDDIEAILRKHGIS